jgi:ABC-type transport system involved in cytochrome c biogenesis permease subunit
MGDFIDVILSNTLYLIITAGILGVMIFFVIKKMTKLFMYATMILIAFLAYIYYTGESVTSTIEPVQKAVEKAEQAVK